MTDVVCLACNRGIEPGEKHVALVAGVHQNNKAIRDMLSYGGGSFHAKRECLEELGKIAIDHYARESK